MNITFLTFYYPPDLSAGSFRAAALVEALSAQLRAEDRVTIITTSPNRYKEASVEAPETETHGPVTIRRVRFPSTTAVWSTRPRPLPISLAML